MALLLLYKSQEHCANGTQYCRIVIMGSFTFILTQLVLVLAVSASPADNTFDFLDMLRISNYTQGSKCPGKIFYNDCNICISRPDGVSATCTEMPCSERNTLLIDNYLRNMRLSRGSYQACSCSGTCVCSGSAVCSG
ncbi:PREDICTED: uncharacterized protein LOC108378045 isoform X3 [Rhagoletis zephyria]|uniref:uncharacterized protein LOC108378045 isoform X3 n=1 Tax=Rhagoletis zephyria TaxID=28612 RepID=UPI000811A64F|nr:PREDICTED: uncharacterized protein LOC108378045 isoform X3 [Rhagoletis zephyria]